MTLIVDRPVRRIILALAAVCVAMLLVAMARLPYSYYQFLRWIVCASCLWFLLHAIRLKAPAIAILLGLLAITYNPLAPIHFRRGTWAVVNVISALAIALTAIFVLRLARGSLRPQTREHTDTDDSNPLSRDPDKEPRG